MTNRERILATQGRQLDWLVVQHVFGDRIRGDDWLDQREKTWRDISAVPEYHRDYNACRAMEDEIYRRQLHQRYAVVLQRLICKHTDVGLNREELYQLIHAYSEDRCRAALLTIEQTQEKLQ
jgi:hypothetical protein